VKFNYFTSFGIFLFAILSAFTSLQTVIAASLAGIDKYPSNTPLVLPPYIQQEKNPSNSEASEYKAANDRQNFSAIPGAKITLKEVIFKGNIAFSDSQLKEVCLPFINQQVSLGDLEELRFRLTNLYVQTGYVNSGVVIPEQHISDGVVTFNVIEGQLKEVNIKGNERLNEDYIRERLFINTSSKNSKNTTAFNSKQLQKGFRQLLADPLIERLNGKIKPGLNKGEAVLDLEVTRARPYDISLLVDNHSSPSSGEIRAMLNGTIRNLTGYGDNLDLSFNTSEGNDDYSAYFSLPISAENSRFFISYVNSESSVIEESLAAIDIESKYSTFSLGFSHPIKQSLNSELIFGLAFTRRKSQTFLLGEGAPFSEGVETDGRSSTSVLRFSQDYMFRQAAQIIAARSTLNMGLSILDATIHENNVADSKFVSWLGQAQYAYRFQQYESQLISRANIQLANQRLLSLEQMSVGGPDSVRGYRTNQYVRDNGIDASIEYRHPIYGNPMLKNQMNIQLAGFFDAGTAWNKGESRSNEILSSAGIGLLWTWDKLSAELYWAHPFKEFVQTAEYALQDDGISFRLHAKY